MKRSVNALWVFTLGAGLTLGMACEQGSDRSDKRSVPGGVISAEPAWAQNVKVEYGGAAVDTTRPGSYGYYEEDGAYATIYDADGEPFRFKKGQVKRIINLWPANTSGALALGAEKFFIARCGSALPPWQKLMFPRYAGLADEIQSGAGAANVEALMRLEPDLIIGHPSSVANLRDVAYGGRKLPVININFQTYHEMKITYRVIGQILGGRVEEKAEWWGQMLQTNLDRVARGLRQNKVRPVIYYSAGGISGLGSTLPATGKSVVTNEWTGYAGGKYWPELMRVMRQDYLTSQTGVNMELILRYPPQKIFIGGGRRPEMAAVVANTDVAANPWAGIIASLGADNVQYIPYALFDWGGVSGPRARYRFFGPRREFILKFSPILPSLTISTCVKRPRFFIPTLWATRLQTPKWMLSWRPYHHRQAVNKHR